MGINTVLLSADVDYRLSSRARIGLDYSFNHFGYTPFGSADVHGAAVDYSWRATRTVDLAFQIGMAHSGVLALTSLPTDPAVAAIIGIGTGIQVSDRVFNTPRVNARVTKRWRSVSADLNYRRGISPGNGLVLTSREESITAGLEYSRANRWTASLQAGRATMEQLISTSSYTSSYTGNTFGASVTRFIRRGLQAVARFDVRPVSYIGVQGDRKSVV